MKIFSMGRIMTDTVLKQFVSQQRYLATEGKYSNMGTILS